MTSVEKLAHEVICIKPNLETFQWRRSRTDRRDFFTAFNTPLSSMDNEANTTTVGETNTGILLQDPEANGETPGLSHIFCEGEPNRK